MYNGVGKDFEGGHKTVNHSKGEYANGDVHVNSAESFFALLTRALHGTFHRVSKQHTQRYCDAFAFRWDWRKTTDGDRAAQAIRGAEGKRLMYAAPPQRQITA